MKKDFFNKFPKQENLVIKQISLSERDWKRIEAYRLYGTAKAETEIPTKLLLRELVMDNIEKDRAFRKEEEKWLSQVETIYSVKNAEA